MNILMPLGLGSGLVTAVSDVGRARTVKMRPNPHFNLQLSSFQQFALGLLQIQSQYRRLLLLHTIYQTCLKLFFTLILEIKFFFLKISLLVSDFCLPGCPFFPSYG